MKHAEFLWCLAGGYAVERFVGRAFREHGDTDIVVLRRDQLALQSWLTDWKWYAADPPGTLRPWKAGEALPIGIHDIWGHREASRAWELQIMIQECDGDSWYFRRDDRIRGSVGDLVQSLDGVPCLRVDLQLLYKSKGLRDKDELDFTESLPRLGPEQRDTLASWLRVVYPQGHPWQPRLTAPLPAWRTATEEFTVGGIDAAGKAFDQVIVFDRKVR
jgi:hypothetical protein